jgi:hypothetical protein
MRSNTAAKSPGDDCSCDSALGWRVIALDRAHCASVKIAFTIGEQRAEFYRNSATSRAELRIGDDVVCLQSPYHFKSQFDLRTRITWRRRVGDHEVEIVKVRPRVLGGARPNSYTVAVDGVTVAEVTGM